MSFGPFIAIFVFVGKKSTIHFLIRKCIVKFNGYFQYMKVKREYTVRLHQKIVWSY